MLDFIIVEILSLNKTSRCKNISNELIWDGHCYYTNTGRLFAILAEAKRVRETVPLTRYREAFPISVYLRSM